MCGNPLKSVGNVIGSVLGLKTKTPAIAAAPAAPAAPAAAPPPSAGPAAAVEDAPVTAVDVLRSLVAQKLKKSLADIPLTKAIKDLVGGKFLSLFLLIDRC